MKNKTLLIGTTNDAKVNEYKKLFSIFLERNNIELIGLKDVTGKGKSTEPKENGKTICENARIKAMYYAKKYNLITLSDDGGFFIDALNGAPGIKAHRWAGEKASDEDLINKTLNELKGIGGKDARRAEMRVCIFVYNPLSKRYVDSEGSMMGRVAEAPTKRRIKGFPYRALFIVEPIGKYYDDLSENEHLRYNHRFKAFRNIAVKIHALL